MEILGFAASVFIGFSLGLIGGGGSILSVPILVYLFSIEPVLATGYSLFVVGTSSAVGAFNYMRKGLMDYKTAMVFVVPSFIAVFLTRKFLVPAIPNKILSFGKIDITSDVFFIMLLVVVMLGISLITLNVTFKDNKKHFKVFLLVSSAAVMVFVVRQFIIPVIPHELIVIGNFTLTKNIGIMVFFAIIMMLASISMIRGRRESPGDPESKDLIGHSIFIVILGILVGSVTGLVGAGGGFLIIPALVIIAGLPIKTAIGTSLLIIAVNSLMGFLGDIQNEEIHWVFLLSFTGLSVLGIFLGSWVSKFVDNRNLKKIFGWFILIMGFYIIGHELFMGS